MNFQIKNFAATLVLCFACLIAKADTFSVTIADKNSFKISLLDRNTDQVQVSLKDNYGASVYEDRIASKKVTSRTYDLHQLPKGRYTLIVAYDKTIKVQTIQKEFDNIEINEAELQTIFEPVFKQHSEYIDLNMLCLTEHNISLYINDNEGNLIYSETTKPHGSLAKRFNLMQLNKGFYTISLRIEDSILDTAFEKSFEWTPVIASL